MCVLVWASVIRLPFATSNSVHIRAELVHLDLIRWALPAGRRRFDYHLVGARTAATNHQKTEQNEYGLAMLRRMRHALRFVNMPPTQNYPVAAGHAYSGCALGSPPGMGEPPRL